MCNVNPLVWLFLFHMERSTVVDPDLHVRGERGGLKTKFSGPSLV